MRKRHKLSKKSSRKLFAKTASRTNGRNVHSNPMRGGIRL